MIKDHKDYIKMKLLALHLHGRSEENHNKLSQHSNFQNQDSNQATPICERMYTKTQTGS
jgi:hypothetical protein